MATGLQRLAYEAAQTARVGWFFGQKILAQRLTRAIEVPDRLRGRKMPDLSRLLADLRRMLEQDWRNVEAGLYTAPEDWRGNPLTELRRAFDFFADLGAVEARRHGERRERLLSDEPEGTYPPYYLQHFHFQTGGYLTEESAERYDHQVEVLFGGGAAAMRRQALVPLRAALLQRGDGGRGARLLDIGCGTGVFLREVKRNYPRLGVYGLDLSQPYLAVARRRLAEWSRVTLRQGAGEALPFGDASFDAVSCIYLLHELPPRVRRSVMAEIRRVLRPGGTLIVTDTLQTGDQPDYDALLEIFPVAFHEPYYAGYLREDLDALFGSGLVRKSTSLAYFSKILSCRRTYNM